MWQLPKTTQLAVLAMAINICLAGAVRVAQATVLVATDDSEISDYHAGVALPWVPAINGARLNTNARYYLDLNNANADRNDLMIIRFDISGLTEPVTSANFNITSAQVNNAHAVNVFGVYAPNAGEWVEGSAESGVGVVWSSPEINNDGVNGLFFFYDGTDASVTEEVAANHILYDVWDLVPNGSTDTSGLIAVELFGSLEAGVAVGPAQADMTYSFSGPTLVNFLEQARLNGQTSVTMLVGVRDSGSNRQLKVYTHESTSAVGHPGASVTDQMKPNLVINEPFCPEYSPIAVLPTALQNLAMEAGKLPDPGSVVYSLYNPGLTASDYSLSVVDGASQPITWLTITPPVGSGTLPAASTATVTATLNDDAKLLPIGIHVAYLNLAAPCGFTENRSIYLTVVEPIPGIQVLRVAMDDTEMGDWTSTNPPSALGTRLNTNARYNRGSALSSNRNDFMMFKFDISDLSGKLTGAALNITTTRNDSNSFNVNVFGVFEDHYGPWAEATVNRVDATINNDGSNGYFFFDDGSDNSLFSEQADFLYDQWDLVPNGDTTTEHLVASELVGNVDDGLLIGATVASQTITFDQPAVLAFLREAVARHDSTVTMLVFTRGPTTDQLKVYTHEATDDTAVAGTNDLVDAQRPNLTLLLAPCHEPSVDGDGDGDVDMADFAIWQSCYSGPFAAMPLRAECKCFDPNDDNRLAASELQSFLNCFSGPSVPADPNCLHGN